MTTTKKRPAQPGRYTATGVQKPPYTWAGHTWVPASMLTPLIPCALIGAAIVVLHAADVSAAWSVWGSLAILLASGLSAVGERFAQTTIAYMWLLGLYWFGWYGWAAFDFAWQFAVIGPDGARHGHTTFWGSLIAYIAGVFITWCLWPSMRKNQIAEESRQYAVKLRMPAAQLVTSQAALDADDTSRAGQWVSLFTRLGKKGLTFVEEDPNDAGVSVRLRLPIPGAHPDVPAIPFSSIASPQFREVLEQAMDLREGAIRIEQYRNPQTRQRSTLDFVMHVDYEDILAKIVPMEHPNDDDLMMSISDAFPVGRMADGTYLCLTLREIHAMIVGATREGKSNLLHIIIYQVTRCYDAAIWMIDLKGGATARPWLMPWVKGAVKRPILDWVAIDRWEAARILLAAIDIVTDRPLRRRGSKTEPQRAGMPMNVTDPATDKRKIATRDVVAVVLLTDEISELVGTAAGPTMTGKKEGFTSSALAGLVTRFSALAAGEAFYGMFAGQRSTADMFGNPSAQVNIGLKVAVGQMNRQEAGMVFGNSSPEAVEMTFGLEHKGSIVAWRRNIDRTLPTKVFFAGDEHHLDTFCWNAAVRHDGIPASVETDRYAHARAAEWGFDDRWTDRRRCGWLYLGEDALDDEGAVVGWESVPLPLDAMNQPIPASQWAQMQARVDATTARAAGAAGTLTDTVTLHDLENVARQAQGLPSIPAQGGPVAETSAEIAAQGGAGFWPEADLKPAPPAPTTGPITTDAAAVDKMLDGFAAYLNNPETAGPADDEDDDEPQGLMLKVLQTAKLVDSYGRDGVTASELARDMIAHKIITEKGRKGYRRIVLRAMEAGAVMDPYLRIEQPGGIGGRYFTHRHTIVNR